jgi:CheY-like chemotaxis protein
VLRCGTGILPVNHTGGTPVLRYSLDVLPSMPVRSEVGAGDTVVAIILTCVEDLVFLSKIEQTARLLNVAVRRMDLSGGSPIKADEQARAVILDLNHRSNSPLEFVRRWKSDAATKDIPILGFVSHVQTDLITAAREAGCDIVLARSAFTQQLPRLLERLAGSRPFDTATPASG